MADSKSELKSSVTGGKSIFERINIDLERLGEVGRGNGSRNAERKYEGSRFVHRSTQNRERNSHNARSEPYSPEAHSGKTIRRVTVDQPPTDEAMYKEEKIRKWKHDRFDGSANAPASTVFVRGLQKNVSEQRLRALFENQDCQVCMLKIERAPLTTAVIGFTRRDAAAKAVQVVHGKVFMGEPIKVMVWERESNTQQLREQMRAQEAAETEQMLLELISMQKDVSPESKLRWKTGKRDLISAVTDDEDEMNGSSRRSNWRRQITMASMVPKQSVFDRVS